MLKRYPDFDVRNYGTNLLSKLLDEFDRVKITKDHSNVTVELVEGTEPPEVSKDGEEGAEAPGETTRKRSRRRRSRKVSVASDETAENRPDATGAAQEEGETPSAGPEALKEDKPTAGADRPKAKQRAGRAHAGDTPQSYIYALVRDAGADGLPLQQLSNAVRDRFKDFKVRDLGFAQMRQYVASIGDFEITKEGRQTNVRLAQ